MKYPQVKPSLLIMTTFVFILSLDSSWCCNTDFEMPLFYGWDSVKDLSSAIDTILANLPEIVALDEDVSFPPLGPVAEAIRTVFKVLNDKNPKHLIYDSIKPKPAEDTLQKLNGYMVDVENKILSILAKEVSVDVKKKDWVTAVNLCEKTLPLFTESEAAFNNAKLASSPRYVVFATVYLTVAQLGKAFNPQYIPKLKKDLQKLLDNLAEYEFSVKPQRKSKIRKSENYCRTNVAGSDSHCWLTDEMTGAGVNDMTCQSPLRQELTKRIKKFFSPVKERIASFLDVPVPVKYQYYTRYGEECYYQCGYFGENYSWCWRLSGFGKDYEYCSAEKDVTRYGVKCKSDHSCGWHKENYYWCWTDSSWPWNWDYCSPITVQ